MSIMHKSLRYTVTSCFPVTPIFLVVGQLLQVINVPRQSWLSRIYLITLFIVADTVQCCAKMVSS